MEGAKSGNANNLLGFASAVKAVPEGLHYYEPYCKLVRFGSSVFSPECTSKANALTHEAVPQRSCGQMSNMISAQRVYFMAGNETLWDTAAYCNQLFLAAGIPSSVCGGVAVYLHGYQRNTIDLDLVIQSQDSERVRQVLEAGGLS